MSISYGLNLGIMNGAADGDLYGDAMRAFQRACDAFLQPIVKGYLTNTPPGAPVDGDMYIVGAAPTGAWASYAGYVAKWSALIAAWEFYLPKNGWQFQSNSAREVYRYTGSAWEIFYQEGTWTPVLTAFSGSITAQSNSGAYIKVGKVVELFGELSVTNNGTGNSVLICGGMPFAVGANAACGVSRERNNMGYTCVLQALARANSFNIYQYDNSYPATNGAVFPFALSYTT